jgi:hypothetical protein
MKGHNALLKMRRDGLKPECAWLLDDDSTASAKSAQDWHTEPNPFTGRLAAYIQLSSADTPELLDLRMLVSLRVLMVCCRSDKRARRVFDSIASANPSFLIAEQGGEIWTHTGGING